MASNINAAGTPFISGRLISHFNGKHRQDQSTGWESLWDSDQSDLWDRGKPSPALIDLVESRPDLLPRPAGPNESKGARLRALVPGCGKGYDVVMLALHGYDAYGLEVSSTAVDTAGAYAVIELAKPSAHNFSDYCSRDRYAEGEQGHAIFIAGDFFSRAWEAACCSDGESFAGFDLIYDYTFLCALLPEMRHDWARRMSELLSPSGVLVCLEFPLYKDMKLPGPPWGLREGVYWNLLAVGGTGMVDENEAQAATQVTGGGAFERVEYIKPLLSYEVAKGTDMLSVWRLRTQTKS